MEVPNPHAIIQPPNCLISILLLSGKIISKNSPKQQKCFFLYQNILFMNQSKKQFNLHATHFGKNSFNLFHKPLFIYCCIYLPIYLLAYLSINLSLSSVLTFYSSKNIMTLSTHTTSCCIMQWNIWGIATYPMEITGNSVKHCIKKAYLYVHIPVE